MPTAEEFRDALFETMADALRAGHEYLEIDAGELHRRLGGYPGPDDRIPNYCHVMKAQVSTEWGDVILHDPPSGQGASLRIRYRVPRPEPWSSV
jgi:hypothetical protein